MTGVNGKVVIVTGAAAGIGASAAKLFAAKGATVVVTDVDRDGGEATVRDITKAGGRALLLEQDVSSEADWQRVVAATVDEFGGIDVLVNNAGIYFIRSLADTTTEAFNRLMAINVTGTWLGAKHVAPELRRRGGGSIINLSSIAGLRGSPNHSAYGSSKGAVRIMTKDLAAELGPDNIRVNSVHPTYVKTQMADQGAEASGLTLDEMGKKFSPLGRLATVEDIANLIVFLANDESSYLTASEFVIDGGGTSVF